MSRPNDPSSAAFVMKSLPRAWDDLPIWAQLNITWKCNLDCVYCTEYDNSKGHVPYEDLVRRIDKCKELGTLRKKIEMVAKYPIWFRVNTVICEQTIDEVQEVAEFCMNLGVPVNFSVV